MAKYRKKPVIVDAIQWTGKNLEEVIAFMVGPDSGHSQLTIDSTMDIVVYTLEGDMKASIGDWLIKGIKGEYYPCKPDIFLATYQKVLRERQQKKVPIE